MLDRPRPAEERWKDSSTSVRGAILDFERGWWQRPEPKDRAIRARSGHSPARYYQLLNHLIDSPDAMAYDPMLAKRLRRLRVARLRQPFGRDPGVGR
jgi:Protein of unknown function (DUF3263)